MKEKANFTLEMQYSFELSLQFHYKIRTTKVSACKSKFNECSNKDYSYSKQNDDEQKGSYNAHEY